MTFAKRSLSVKFSDNSGILSLDGYRAQALINNPGGYVAFNSMQLNIYGMNEKDMLRYSAIGQDQIALKQVNVSLFAGDEGGRMTEVFNGTLVKSGPILQAPEVYFSVSGVSAFYEKSLPQESSSPQGEQSAFEIIRGMANNAGLNAVFSGEDVKLRKIALYGSAAEQIVMVARAAYFGISFEGRDVFVWPLYGVRDDKIIEVTPANGQIGYPSMWQAGYFVDCEFNPEIKNGRTVRLKSSGWAPANGDWQSVTVTHNLASQLHGGPWSTRVQFAPPAYVQ